MNRVGGDGGKGREYEGAFGHAGMGDDEAGGVDDLAAIQEDVEVEGAWAVGDAVGAVAAEAALDLEEMAEEELGIETGFESDGGVEEGGLIGEAYRLGDVVGGLGCDVA